MGNKVLDNTHVGDEVKLVCKDCGSSMLSWQDARPHAIAQLTCDRCGGTNPCFDDDPSINTTGDHKWLNKK